VSQIKHYILHVFECLAVVQLACELFGEAPRQIVVLVQRLEQRYLRGLECLLVDYWLHTPP